MKKGKSQNFPVYRGRRRRSTVLKVVVILLAVVLACGLVAVLVMGSHIEYTDSGVRLVLPWISDEEDSRQSIPEETDVIIAEDPVVSSESEPEPVAEPEPESEDKQVLNLNAVEVDPSSVTDGTAASLVRQSGGDAMVVTVKDVEGHLAWFSSSELAQTTIDGSGAVLNGEEAFSEAVQALSSGSLYLVARVNCFEDLWMCVYHKTMALTTSENQLWYDLDGMPWLSPANEEATAYLTELCLELAELGFDEILLDCAGFPGSGRLSSIGTGANYQADELDQAVMQWLTELSDALSGTGVKLSVQASADELTDGGESGLNAAALAAAADRIWIMGSEDLSACVQALEKAGMNDPDQFLVLSEPLSAENQNSWSGSTVRWLE